MCGGEEAENTRMQRKVRPIKAQDIIIGNAGKMQGTVHAELREVEGAWKALYMGGRMAAKSFSFQCCVCVQPSQKHRHMRQRHATQQAHTGSCT